MIKNANRRRRMRQRREAVMKKEPIAMIDIGSSKIAVMVVQFMQSGKEKLPAYGFRVLATDVRKSNGIGFGEVVNKMAFISDLIAILERVQRIANQRVNYAMVSFSGGRPRSFGTVGEVTVANGEVSENDIGRALLACDIPHLDDGQEFLHMMPINFTLDDKTGLKDPRGLIGARLAADMHLLGVDGASTHAIETAMREVYLDVVGITTSGFCTGLGVLTEDELKRGAVVIDFGAMVTSVSVFFANQLMFTRNIHMGGYHVTSDISHAFRISFEQAEKIKTMFGGLEATARDDLDKIEIYEDEFRSTENYVVRSDLIGVIRPRMEEIFEEINRILEEASAGQIATDRFVISGGASQISGLEEFAERYFSQRVRIGRPLKLSGAATQQESLTYAAVSGLAVYTASPKDELWDFADLKSKNSPLDLRTILDWFRQNW